MTIGFREIANHRLCQKREIARGTGAETDTMLTKVLSMVEARRMVIGHTMTRHAPNGRQGQILTRFKSRLVYSDVGIRGGDGQPRAALVVEGPIGRKAS